MGSGTCVEFRELRWEQSRKKSIYSLFSRLCSSLWIVPIESLNSFLRNRVSGVRSHFRDVVECDNDTWTAG